MMSLETKTPTAAAWLGGLGAIPFVALATAAHAFRGPVQMQCVHALFTYGATIISFLGGVHWGLAISPERSTSQAALKGWLILSVIPSLAGWTALLFPPVTGMIILSASFLAMLWIDLRATRVGQAPAWYPRLRTPLTGLVVASLVAGVLS